MNAPANDIHERMSVESACYLGCHVCKREGILVDDQRCQALVVHRGLVIVCHKHGEIGSLTPAELREKMTEAAARDERQGMLRQKQEVGRA